MPIKTASGRIASGTKLTTADKVKKATAAHQVSDADCRFRRIMLEVGVGLTQTKTVCNSAIFSKRDEARHETRTLRSIFERNDSFLHAKYSSLLGIRQQLSEIGNSEHEKHAAIAEEERQFDEAEHNNVEISERRDAVDSKLNNAVTALETTTNQCEVVQDRLHDARRRVEALLKVARNNTGLALTIEADKSNTAYFLKCVFLNPRSDSLTNSSYAVFKIEHTEAASSDKQANKVMIDGDLWTLMKIESRMPINTENSKLLINIFHSGKLSEFITLLGNYCSR